MILALIALVALAAIASLMIHFIVGIGLLVVGLIAYALLVGLFSRPDTGRLKGSHGDPAAPASGEGAA